MNVPLKKEKNYIIFIIVVTTIALIGLTCFQAYWMSFSISQRKIQIKEQFQISMYEIVERVDKFEAIKKAERSGKLSSFLGDSNSDLFIELSKDIYLQDSILNKLNFELRLGIEKDVKKINTFVRDFLSIDYYAKFEDRISKEDLETIVYQTLEKNEFNNNVDYALMGLKGEIIYTNIEDSTTLKELEFTPYSAKLFPNDFFNSEFVLHFLVKNETNSILKSMWSMLLLSILFLITIVTAFFYNISTIYKQKKLSIIKNDFINNMTHELKTPISTISLACEALIDEDLSKSEKNRKRFIKTIDEENQRLGGLVENVLQSATVEKQTLNLKKELLIIHSVIDKSIKNCALQVSNKSGIIIKKFHAKNTILEGDKTHLANVFSNLIDNALKYSSAIPEIEIFSEDVINGVVIKIKDNGIGIAREHQTKIFDKLYRVPTGDIHDVKGFGLGLSYVKSIVEKHNGSIKVDSQLGDGSTFVIKLESAKED